MPFYFQYMDKKRLTSLNTDRFTDRIFCFDEISSTNEAAKEMAVRGKECLITAETQIAGKGRFDRTFESKKGGLYMSVCLKVSSATLDRISKEAGEESRAVFQLGERLLEYPVQAGEAVRAALMNLYGESFDIKLPNDIFFKGKKVCGILMEAVHHDEDIYLIFGIGVNMENELSKELSEAGNLKNLSGKTVERELLCTEIIQELCKIL